MSWEEVELCDISEYRTERIEVNLLNEKNYVSTENMLSERGGIVDSSYPPSGNNSPAFKSNDILVSNIRPYFKKIWFAQNDGGCSNDVIVFKPLEEKVDPKFLYYQLSKDEFFDFMMSGANGTKMPRGNKKAIPKFKLLIPKSLQTQKRIASILSAYDDLIENNLKRIKLLEETAQNIYKEWFVNFRFPNYENTPINQETGLPAGWEVKKISSIVEFKGGFPFKSSEYTESGKYRIVTIKNVGDRFFDRNNTSGIENIPDKMKEYCKLQEGNILMSLTGNIGRTCLVYGDNFLLNQRVVIINPTNSENSAFCYFLFNTDSIKGLMNNLASGVAQQNLSPVKLEEQLIPLPPLNLMLRYSTATNGIVNQIISLNKQNQKLKEARDILLPRLMNRTIEV